MCGNFNLTNVDEIFEKITAKGQHPRKYADTYIMLEEVGHRLDREVERLYAKCENEGLEGMDITYAIEDQIDLANVLKKTTPGRDGRDKMSADLLMFDKQFALQLLCLKE